jgi:hypothetical protein
VLCLSKTLITQKPVAAFDDQTFFCSERIVQLAPMIMESGAAHQMLEDYAACLEAASTQPEAPDNPEEDSVFLILKVSLRRSHLFWAM